MTKNGLLYFDNFRWLWFENIAPFSDYFLFNQRHQQSDNVAVSKVITFLYSFSTLNLKYCYVSVSITVDLRNQCNFFKGMHKDIW